MCDLCEEKKDCVKLALITARSAKEKGWPGYYATTLSGLMLNLDGTIYCRPEGGIEWHRVAAYIPDGMDWKEAFAEDLIIYLEGRSDGILIPIRLGEMFGEGAKVRWEPTRDVGFIEKQPGIRRV